MKFFRYIIYSLIVLCLFLIPLYAAGRLVLPNYLKTKIISNLPKGSSLTIGSIYSETDLSIIFEKVNFKSNSNNFILSSSKNKNFSSFK